MSTSRPSLRQASNRQKMAEKKNTASKDMRAATIAIKRGLSEKLKPIAQLSIVQQIVHAINDIIVKKGQLSAANIEGTLTKQIGQIVKPKGMTPQQFRTAAAGGSPETECKKARLNKPMPVKGLDQFMTQMELASNWTPMPNPVTNTEDAIINDFGGSTYIMAWDGVTTRIDKKTGKEIPALKNTKYNFTPTHKYDCGNCWICDIKVLALKGLADTGERDITDEENNFLYKRPTAYKYNGKILPRTPVPEGLVDSTSGCGDCDHLAAINATLLNGALAAGGATDIYWASYAMACISCNRFKSDIIGVRLVKQPGSPVTYKWDIDETGITNILNPIFPREYPNPHESESNPLRLQLEKDYYTDTNFDKIQFINNAKDRMRETYQHWCDIANFSFEQKSTIMNGAVTLTSLLDTIGKNIEAANIEAKLNKQSARSKPKIDLSKIKKRKMKGGDPNDSNDIDDMTETDSDDEYDENIVEFNMDTIHEDVTKLVDLFADNDTIFVNTGVTDNYKELLINLDVSLLELLPNDIYVNERVNYLISGIDQLLEDDDLQNFNTNYGKIWGFYTKLMVLIDKNSYIPNEILTDNINLVQTKLKQFENKMQDNKQNENMNMSVNNILPDNRVEISTTSGGKKLNKIYRKTLKKRKLKKRKTIRRINKNIF